MFSRHCELRVQSLKMVPTESIHGRRLFAKRSVSVFNCEISMQMFCIPCTEVAVAILLFKVQAVNHKCISAQAIVVVPCSTLRI